MVNEKYQVSLMSTYFIFINDLECFIFTLRTFHGLPGQKTQPAWYCKVRKTAISKNYSHLGMYCKLNVKTSIVEVFCRSGESGSGKTESTKLLMKYLVALSSNNLSAEQQLIQANPVLEGECRKY